MFDIDQELAAAIHKDLMNSLANSSQHIAEIDMLFCGIGDRDRHGEGHPFTPATWWSL